MDSDDVPTEAAVTPITLLPPAPASIVTIDDVLDATTILTALPASRSDEERVHSWVGDVEANTKAAILARGSRDRAKLGHAKALLQERLDELQLSATPLIEDEKAVAALQKQLDELQPKLDRKQRELDQKRVAEARVRLAEQLQQLDVQRQEAHEKLQRVALEDFAERKKAWEASAGDSDRRIDELEGRAGKLRQLADEIQQRASRFSATLITRTVAGFLCWIGYASVPATGAVFAQLIDDDFTIDWVLTTARTFADLPGGSWWRFASLFGLLLACVLLLLISTLGVDSLMSRFDRRWREREARGNAIPGLQFGQSNITRRSYVRLLASLPYVLLGCMTVAFVAAGQTKEGVFRHLLATVTNTAIGSTVAMLATAVLMMYAIKVIEPRGIGDSFRRSWEFALPPAALIAAVVLAAYLARDVRWGMWMLFMLLGSLSLAYGLVYHGVYKDIDKSEERLGEVESEIRFYRFGPERPPLSPRALQRQVEIDADYARERLRIEKVDRALHVGNLNDARRSSPAKPQWFSLQWLPFMRRERASRIAPIDFDTIDQVMPSQLLDDLTALTLQKSRLEEDKSQCLAKIKDVATSREQRLALRRELAETEGLLGELVARDEELIARAAKGANEVRILVLAQAAATRSLRPSAQTVMNDAARAAIRPPHPELPPGGDPK